jgi:hypothetical protein
MLLLTHQVRLGQPGPDLVVNLFRCVKSKRVQLVARGIELDSGKARAVEPAGEHHMAVDPTPPQGEGGEAHPDLECDARLFGQDCNGTGLPGFRHEPLKRSDNVWFTAGEMLL